MCQQYSFRYKAIRDLLDEAANFNRKTFISATPLEWKYWLDEIKPFPEIILRWPKCELPQVNSFFVDKPLVYMVSRCKERLLNGGDTNFHIFLNSVDDIGMIVSGAGLTPDNTKIVCSTSEGNNNQDKLPPGFSIGKAGDPPKLFNLYTSTCFEGCDIFDEDGEIFIVSDALKPHTMMDISTSFIQIAGRIRNSKYKNQVTQIYSSSRYRKGITAEQYEKDTMEKLKEVEGWIKWMNECPDELKPSFLKQIPYMNEPYVKIVGDQVILDKNMAYQDIVNFKIVHWDYLTPVNMKKRLEEANLQIASSSTIQAQGDIDTPIKIRSSFKELFELYCELQSKITYSFSLTEDERIHYIRMYKPLVIEAFQKLGAEKVREMKYHIGDIKRAIVSQTSAKEDYKITEMLSQVFPLHVPIPVKDIKCELQKIYKAIGKKTAAKARDVGKK